MTCVGRCGSTALGGEGGWGLESTSPGRPSECALASAGYAQAWAPGGGCTIGRATWLPCSPKGRGREGECARGMPGKGGDIAPVPAGARPARCSGLGGELVPLCQGAAPGGLLLGRGAARIRTERPEGMELRCTGPPGTSGDDVPEARLAGGDCNIHCGCCCCCCCCCCATADPDAWQRGTAARVEEPLLLKASKSTWLRVLMVLLASVRSPPAP
mmetsp:Transcript_87594/g.261275  ORF Transcript_87594/g.261275 Transcript_87594/m.261275 type:complete len:215 (+) Transcript_87594:258-902(+)